MARLEVQPAERARDRSRPNALTHDTRGAMRDCNTSPTALSAEQHDRPRRHLAPVAAGRDRIVCDPHS